MYAMPSSFPPLFAPPQSHLQRLRVHITNNKIVPELRIYKLWDKPIGPHPIAMFEINLFTPAQFGAFIPWLVINRGPLSALVHPNTKEIVDGKDVRDEERDHTQRATWMGEPVLLDLSVFKRMKAAAAAAAAKTET